MKSPQFIAVLHRKLKVDKSYDDFYQAWLPPGLEGRDPRQEAVGGKFRAACLNQHWFRTLARDEIETWKVHYNHIRPHSSLNYMPPSVFAEEAA